MSEPRVDLCLQNHFIHKLHAFRFTVNRIFLPSFPPVICWSCVSVNILFVVVVVGILYLLLLIVCEEENCSRFFFVCVAMKFTCWMRECFTEVWLLHLKVWYSNSFRYFPACFCFPLCHYAELPPLCHVCAVQIRNYNSAAFYFRRRLRQMQHSVGERVFMDTFAVVNLIGLGIKLKFNYIKNQTGITSYTYLRSQNTFYCPTQSNELYIVHTLSLSQYSLSPRAPRTIRILSEFLWLPSIYASNSTIYMLKFNFLVYSNIIYLFVFIACIENSCGGKFHSNLERFPVKIVVKQFSFLMIIADSIRNELPFKNFGSYNVRAL